MSTEDMLLSGLPSITEFNISDYTYCFVFDDYEAGYDDEMSNWIEFPRVLPASLGISKLFDDSEDIHDRGNIHMSWAPEEGHSDSRDCVNFMMDVSYDRVHIYIDDNTLNGDMLSFQLDYVQNSKGDYEIDNAYANCTIDGESRQADSSNKDTLIDSVAPDHIMYKTFIDKVVFRPLRNNIGNCQGGMCMKETYDNETGEMSIEDPWEEGKGLFENIVTFRRRNEGQVFMVRNGDWTPLEDVHISFRNK